MKNKYICKKCNTVLITRKESGDISINNKSKRILLNNQMIRLVCKCGRTHEIKNEKYKILCYNCDINSL